MSKENRPRDGPEEVSSNTTSETAAVFASHPPSQRFWLTNDLLAVLLVVSFVGLVTAGGMGLVDLTAVPEHITTVYLSVVVTATGWTFGEAAYRTWSGN